MTKMRHSLMIFALILILQSGFGVMVSAAAINGDSNQMNQPAWVSQEQEAQAKKQQEIRRHEQAMLQKENESVADWQWRLWQEHELHIRNMQKLQDDGLQLVVTPVNW